MADMPKQHSGKRDWAGRKPRLDRVSITPCESPGYRGETSRPGPRSTKDQRRGNRFVARTPPYRSLHVRDKTPATPFQPPLLHLHQATLLSKIGTPEGPDLLPKLCAYRRLRSRFAEIISLSPSSFSLLCRGGTRSRTSSSRSHTKNAAAYSGRAKMVECDVST